MSFNPSGAGRVQVLDRSVFQEGTIIFREGDGGSRAYIVQRGRVEFYKELKGERVFVGSVKKGGIFGEMALIDDQPRMATAIVAEPSVCIVISETQFQKKMDMLDPFLAGILRILVENIRSIQDQKVKMEHAGTLGEVEISEASAEAATTDLIDQLSGAEESSANGDESNDSSFEI